MKITLNDQEKEVAVSLLLELMNAAPGVNDTKINFFEAVSSEFKISQENFMAGRELDSEVACSLLNLLDDEKKTLFALTFRKMILLDGQTSSHAINVLNDITIRAHLGEAVKRQLMKLKDNN